MLRLRDIMTGDVAILTPEHTLREAMEFLTTKHISGAPVVVRGKVVGVVSLTDLAEFAAALPTPTLRDAGAPYEEAEVADWAAEDLPPDAYFAELWEDAMDDVAVRIGQKGAAAGNALEEHVVGEVMSRKVMSLPPATPVDTAADVMRRAGVHRLLVMTDAVLDGLVTTKDIANAVADHRMGKRVYVFGNDY